MPIVSEGEVATLPRLSATKKSYSVSSYVSRKRRLLKSKFWLVKLRQKFESRLSLLDRCGASVVYEMEPHHLEDAFLVIANKPSAVGAVGESETGFIREYLDEPSAGTHFTPDLVIDDNLIISVSTRNGKAIDKAKRLHKRLANQFENKGYGAFIEFLGTRRSEILKTLPTPNKRADFFDTLIDTVEGSASGLQTPPTICCLGLTNPECSAECLFNWVRHGNLARANAFTAKRLDKAGESC